MHSSLPSRSLPCMISLSLLCNLVSSRHIHGHATHRHRHHVRPIAEGILETSITSTTSASFATATEGSAVISDIQEIQNGLTNLRSDIPNFVTAVEQQLQALESMLLSLLSAPAEPMPAATTSPIASILAGAVEPFTPATTPQAPATDYLPVPASTASNTASSSSPGLCLPPDGAGPPVPCPVSSLTQTNVKYVTD